MKRLLSTVIVIAVLFSVLSCNKKKTEGYTINGSIAGADTGWLFLKKREEGKMITADSVQIKDGKFIFMGKVEMPEMYYLKINNKDGALPFFIENSAISMKVFADSIEKSEVTGSATHDLYLTYEKKESSIDIKMEELYGNLLKAKEAKDTVAIKASNSAMDSLQNALPLITKDFAMQNVKSVIAPYVILGMAWAYTLDDIRAFNKAMDSSIAKSNYTKALAERETILTKVQPGQLAPEFIMNDTLGKPVSLSSFKGKVVLIDFWASWCRPCRAENPNVVDAFKKFGSKGFTVLGVSLDTDKSKWEAAIAKDGLTWTHVSDLARWQNAAAKQYGVMSIPANFLVDKDGKIIASGLHGEALAKKLEEVLGK
jgi:peroxiredoxin